MTTKRTQGVLFDLDGTLLDTADDLGAALNYVLAKHGQAQIERKVFRPVASDGAKGLLTLGFGEKLSQYNYDRLRDEFLTYYQQHIADNTCLYPGVAKLIEHIEQQNIPWGIVTNKPEGLTLALLPHYPELANCRTIIGGDTLPTRKPDPQPLIHAAKQLAVDTDACLYIGDALRDIKAGNSAQMITLVAAWGYIKVSDDISQWQADHIVQNAEDCLMYINSAS